MGTFVSSRQVRQNINLMTPWWLSGASIDLDFDNSRYYDSSLGASASLAPLNSYLSISRASTKYAKTAAGTLTSFGNDTLAITDLGLNIEDARTNFVNYSQDLDNAGITKNEVTISANATNAPDGSATMDLATESVTASADHYCQPTTYSSASNIAYTLSGYFKTNGRDIVLRANANGDLTYAINLTTGVATAYGGFSGLGSWTNPSCITEALPNGVWRVMMTGTRGGAGTSISMQFWLYNGSTHNYTGNGTSGVYMWGLQLEAGAFASSYIPTAGASATRATDVVSMSGSLTTLIQGSAVSVVLDAILPADMQRYFVARSDGGASGIYPHSSTQIGTFNGSTVLTSNLGSGTWTTTGVKGAASWNASGRSVVGNNGTVGTDASTMPTMTSPVLAGAAGAMPFAYIRRATFWNSRLADATLQSLTAP